jgi:hypothetical protein
VDVDDTFWPVYDVFWAVEAAHIQSEARSLTTQGPNTTRRMSQPPTEDPLSCLNLVTKGSLDQNFAGAVFAAWCILDETLPTSVRVFLEPLQLLQKYMLTS